MTQEILTYLILLATIIIAARNIIRAFASESGKCSSCAMSGNGCRLAEMKKKNNPKRQQNYFSMFARFNNQ